MNSAVLGAIAGPFHAALIHAIVPSMGYEDDPAIAFRVSHQLPAKFSPTALPKDIRVFGPPPYEYDDLAISDTLYRPKIDRFKRGVPCLAGAERGGVAFRSIGAIRITEIVRQICFGSRVAYDKAGIDRGGLAAILPYWLDLQSEGVFLVLLKANIANIHIGPQLVPRGVPGNPVGISGLPERDNNKNYTGKGKERSTASDPVRPIGGIRCFFGRDSSAPLGAQVGGLVVLSLITAVGTVVGIGRVIRRRRSGYLWLLLGVGGWCFLLWWTSPC